jgi:hypothetical protein
MASKLSAAASASPRRTLVGSRWAVPFSDDASATVALVSTTTGIAADFIVLRGG